MASAERRRLARLTVRGASMATQAGRVIYHVEPEPAQRGVPHGNPLPQKSESPGQPTRGVRAACRMTHAVDRTQGDSVAENIPG
jgi:hypothetical protein